MAKQLKLLSPFYDVNRIVVPSFFGAVRVAQFSPNRIRFVLGIQSDGPTGWSHVEPSVIEETILIGQTDAGSFNVGGQMQLKWTDDYTACADEIWLFTAGSSATAIGYEVIYHPER